MQGDFSRQTFDPLRHFSRVLMQQGRVQLDADWNEQVAILLHYVQTFAKDIIGPHGGPVGAEGGFDLHKWEVPTPTGEKDFVISAGHYYVDGILCELAGTPISILGLPLRGNSIQVEVPTLIADHQQLQNQYVEIWNVASPSPALLMQGKISKVDPECRLLTLDPDVSTKISDVSQIKVQDLQLRCITTYLTQPDYPVPDIEKLRGGESYLVYLDVWERHISYLEDAGDLNIREVALGGPDTATRTKVVWQVKVLKPVPQKQVQGTNPNQVIIVPKPSLSQVYLRARAKQEQPPSDPCLIQPDARYRGAENQLYRVEVHTGGTVGSTPPPTFKWSRENGSVIFPIKRLQDSTTTLATATLANLGRDKHLGLTVGDWVEIVDDDMTLRNEPGKLVQVEAIDPTNMTVTFKTVTDMPRYANDDPKHPLLRRWDYQARDNDPTLAGLPCKLSTTDNAIKISESNGEGTASWFVLEDGVQIQFHYRTLVSF
jgi:hypothetical protein